MHILADHDIREMMHSGFPARLHYRLELWGASGFFDDLKRQTEWDVIVRYNPLKRRYTATRIEGERITALGSFDNLDPIEAMLSQATQPALAAPDGHDKYYYNLVLDVQMLSVSDLDEVERWLKGDLGACGARRKESRHGDRPGREDADHEAPRRPGEALRGALEGVPAALRSRGRYSRSRFRARAGGVPRAQCARAGAASPRRRTARM